MKLSENEKQTKNLFTYAVIMLLAVIIIIIIAAMADDREKAYQNQINQTQETANTVQNEIVSLKDQLYQVQQENENLQTMLENNQTYLAQFAALNQVWTLMQSGDLENAQTAFAAIDTSAFDETLNAYYASLAENLGIELPQSGN